MVISRFFIKLILLLEIFYARDIFANLGFVNIQGDTNNKCRVINHKNSTVNISCVKNIHKINYESRLVKEAILSKNKKFATIRFFRNDIAIKKLNNSKYQIISILDLPSKINKVNNQIYPPPPNKVFLSEHDQFDKLIFPLDKTKTATAAFIRENFVWIIFDQAKNYDFSNIASQLQDFKIIQNKDKLIIKFSYKFNIKLVYQEDRWQLYLAKNNDTSFIPAILINENFVSEFRGAFFAIKSAANFFEIKDQDIGDSIIIIPVYDSNTGVAVERRFVDFDLAKTAQGMMLIKKSNNIKVINHENGIEVISPNYVNNLDLAGDVLEASKKMLSNQASNLNLTQDYKTLLPYFDGVVYEDKNYVEDLRKINLKILGAKNTEVNNYRLELANFYFKHGLFKESLAIFEIIKKANPEFFNKSPKIGFSYIFLNIINNKLSSVDDLIKSFKERGDLPSHLIDEVDIWLNYANFIKGRANSEVMFVDNIDKFIFVYPYYLQFKLAISQLEYILTKQQLNDQDIKAAEYIIENLNRPINKSNLNNDLLFISAKYYLKTQKDNLAKSIFEELRMRVNDPKNRARAELEIIKINLAKKQLNAQDAIKKLNMLKTVWRGDDVEVEILDLIANLYKQNGEMVEAMRVYNYMIANVSNINTIKITGELSKLFNSIFVAGGYSEVYDDFHAIALFNEFRALTPIGLEGDQIVLNIAKRLINLDLLTSAESLLQYQINYRLREDDRVNIASKLATIYLLDNKTQEAIDILNETDKYNYSHKEYQERIRIRSKAMIAQKNYEEALRLVANDNSSEADLLRREAYFYQADWFSLIKLLEPKITEIINNKQKFTKFEEWDLLILVISYGMLQNYNKIDMIKEKAIIENESLKDYINTISLADEAIDYSDLAKIVPVDNFKKFLEIKKSMFFSK